MMLIRSHSLPALNLVDTAMTVSGVEHPSETRRLPDNSIFKYTPSRVMLNKLENLIQKLKDPDCELEGSLLELLSLAIVKDDDWPKNAFLVWKHYPDTTPCAVFRPDEEKSRGNYETLSEEQKFQCIEVCRDGKETYTVSQREKKWESSGENAFFRVMLAVKADAPTDTISPKQATEFKEQLYKNLLNQYDSISTSIQPGASALMSLDHVNPARAPLQVNNPPIQLKCNPRWANPETRPACKYSPVKVSESTSKETMDSMQAVLDNRINECRKLAMDRAIPGDGSWFSFIRGPQLHEPHLNKATVPAFVISGGSAHKLAAELTKDYSLAWHPKNMRGARGRRAEPIYLLVHKMDYPTYASTMKEVIEHYPNLHLIGWDGGGLTGFGAARAAALAFADTLPYRPERIMMIDQDVVKTEQTRHTNPIIKNKVESLHQTIEQPIVGYGVGYPTRQATPSPFSKTPTPRPSDLDGPAEQFVSIRAPFLREGDGIYPPYMVAGGEDMLMSKQLKLSNDHRNVALQQEMIIKKELEGPADRPNPYWDKGRINTLKALFDAEKNIMIEFEGQHINLDALLRKFEANGWISSHPSDESYNVAACIVERIILRLSNDLARKNIQHPSVSSSSNSLKTGESRPVS
ncbi:hypothetical protein [Pseudomonas syringae]|uniref:hypothetical protein n=1 Tax=Pseudomonas syringae TaxID=317 RepID=UPI001F1D3DC7|nr:hypothetical protein [Pseudomonas syringae]